MQKKLEDEAKKNVAKRKQEYEVVELRRKKTGGTPSLCVDALYLENLCMLVWLSNNNIIPRWPFVADHFQSNYV